MLSAQIGDLYATSVISDVHLNPLGVEVIRQLVERFDVDAVIDSGDITSFGNPLEGEFGTILESVGVHYYIVPGNHDSVDNRGALAQFENVSVIDGETVDIAGVRVLGVGHPVFTADNRLSSEDVDDAVARQALRVRRLVREQQPEVLAVHDPAQAQAAIGEVDVVIAGHTHRRSWTTESGTLLLTVGSSGATGLGAFTVDSDLAYEAAVLYFDDGDLVAVDNIALRGTEGDFRIDRRLVRPPTPQEE